MDSPLRLPDMSNQYSLVLFQHSHRGRWVSVPRSFLAGSRRIPTDPAALPLPSSPPLIISSWRFVQSHFRIQTKHSLCRKEVPYSSLDATEVSRLTPYYHWMDHSCHVGLLYPSPMARILICGGVFEEKSEALVHLPLHPKNYFGLLMSNDFWFVVNMLL